MSFASSSLEKSVELPLDSYSPTPNHYAMPKVGDLLPVKCPTSRAPSQMPPPDHLPLS